MKHLNNQLLAQITALQNSLAPPPSQKRPTAMEAKSGKQSKSRRCRKAASPLHRRNPTMGRVHLIPAKRIDFIIFEGRPRSSFVSKISTSLYESESKKRVYHIIVDSRPSPLMHPILHSLRNTGIWISQEVYSSDLWLGQSDPIQHLCQYQDKMVIHSRNDSLLCWTFSSGL